MQKRPARFLETWQARAMSDELLRKTRQPDVVLCPYYRLIVSLVVAVWPALSVTDNVNVHGALPETR